MQGGYKGKAMFAHRYVGMSEEAIREEIDRLQGELYAMQEALDFLYDDNSEAKKSIKEQQEKLEGLIGELDKKVERLQNTMDYESPMKKQLAEMEKGITGSILGEWKKEQQKLSTYLTVNTILLVVMMVVVVALKFINF